MRVTVCEMHDDRTEFARDWDRLAAHAAAEHSDLIVLPEFPFSKWFCAAPQFDPAVWQAALAEHARWLSRLEELAPAQVIATRPIQRGDQRRNEGFIWDGESGLHGCHEKVYLPEEPENWEATWYQRGDGRFDLAESRAGLAGFLICSELWAMGRAQAYGKQGARLLITPRATVIASLEKWLAGGRAAAVVAGAFALSSNRVSAEVFGGRGWVIDPDGAVLAQTSRDNPILTVEIDPAQADAAKQTYPRYLLD